jgi:hypothetical protein
MKALLFKDAIEFARELQQREQGMHEEDQLILEFHQVLEAGLQLEMADT